MINEIKGVSLKVSHLKKSRRFQERSVFDNVYTYTSVFSYSVCSTSYRNV